MEVHHILVAQPQGRTLALNGVVLLQRGGDVVVDVLERLAGRGVVVWEAADDV
jgi:hypothetical protein